MVKIMISNEKFMKLKAGDIVQPLDDVTVNYTLQKKIRDFWLAGNGVYSRYLRQDEMV